MRHSCLSYNIENDSCMHNNYPINGNWETAIFQYVIDMRSDIEDCIAVYCFIKKILSGIKLNDFVTWHININIWASQFFIKLNFLVLCWHICVWKKQKGHTQMVHTYLGPDFNCTKLASLMIQWFANIYSLFYAVLQIVLVWQYHGTLFFFYSMMQQQVISVICQLYNS